MEKQEVIAQLHAPVCGKRVSLEQAHIRGQQGFAVMPTKATVYAPLAGQIKRMQRGGCEVQSADGTRVTMPLSMPALSLVREGEIVQCGQKILVFCDSLPEYLPVVVQ